MVETDIANCFSAIPHEKLMQAVQERVVDQAVLKLLRAMLRAGVMEDGQVRREVTGHPAGRGRYPRCWATSTCTGWTGHGTRASTGCWSVTADDLVVMCASRQQADAALGRLTGLLADLGLEPKAAKTRIVQLAEGGRGTRLPRFPPPAGARAGAHRQKHVYLPGPLAREQGHAAARDRIRQLTDRSRLLLPVELIVQEINRFLRGWAGYFRYGNSARTLRQDQGLCA